MPSFLFFIDVTLDLSRVKFQSVVFHLHPLELILKLRILLIMFIYEFIDVDFEGILFGALQLPPEFSNTVMGVKVWNEVLNQTIWTFLFEELTNH